MSKEESEPNIGGIYEKTRTFNIMGKALDEVQVIVENVLINLQFTTKSVKLDETLIIVTFLDEKKDANFQKDNKISLYKEQENVYIQVKGEFGNKITTFWREFENLLTKSSKQPASEPVKRTRKRSTRTKPKEEITKEDIINSIMDTISNMGYSIERSEAQEFIDNFEMQFNRLPAMNEVNSIAMGYIKMMKEEDISIEEVEVPEIADVQEPVRIKEEELVVSNEVIKDTTPVSDEPVMGVESEIIEKTIIEEELLIWNPKKEMERINFLTVSTIDLILKMIKKLPENRQKEVINRLREIKKDFDNIEKEHGITLKNWEMSQYSEELVKLTKKNRKDKLIELIEEKKIEMINERIIDELPQLKYEDNEKIIKELVWLNKDEIEQRINKLKEGIKKKLKKKQELFAKSSAGSTCPECGWPAGRSSKKCIRCGYKLIDWL